MNTHSKTARSKGSGSHNDQAAAFITALHRTGWRSLNGWENSGHVFELFNKGSKTIMIQIYPGGHGFEVWRPVTSSCTIAETAVAVELYAADPEGGDSNDHR